MRRSAASSGPWAGGRDPEAAAALDLAPARQRDAEEERLVAELRALEAEVADRLPADAARRVVHLRTVGSADAIARGADLTPPPEDVPAGAVIIRGVTDSWDGGAARGEYWG